MTVLAQCICIDISPEQMDQLFAFVDQWIMPTLLLLFVVIIPVQIIGTFLELRHDKKLSAGSYEALAISYAASGAVLIFLSFNIAQSINFLWAVWPIVAVGGSLIAYSGRLGDRAQKLKALSEVNP